MKRGGLLTRVDISHVHCSRSHETVSGDPRGTAVLPARKRVHDRSLKRPRSHGEKISLKRKKKNNVFLKVKR